MKNRILPCLLLALALPASAVDLTVSGAAKTLDVGTDRVAVFDTTAGGSFTVPEGGATVELLLVGGGGGGGSYSGGGGGAGGFLHLEGVELAAGTYTVAIGAGGAAASSDGGQGGNGGDTKLSLGSTVLHTAHGGGGGGGTSSKNGKAGGSGGGSSIQAGTGGASTATGDEKGNAGGQNSTGNTGVYLPSGGGGAGEAGHHADYGRGVGGAGGDGLPCSITGEEVWYAGGGGAGQYNQETTSGGVKVLATSGRGGKGGGGLGCDMADSTVAAEHCGVDGLGGGGGGGRREGTNAAGSTRRGAPGGCGTLIVRWSAVASGAPRVSVSSVAGSVGSAIVSGTVLAGGASGATLEMAVGPAGGTLGSYETLGTGLATGENFSLPLAGLAEGTTYDYALRVSGGAVAGAATGSFSTYNGAPAALSADPSGATKTTVGTDTVYSFSSAGTYTFTVASRGRARFLMVGGGGAGGTNRGGGGGAGGFIELPAVTLEAGTYTVVVGAGGAVNSASGDGGDGENSVLSLGGAVLYTAHGGGGGTYGSTALLTGHAGGSGGGGNACAASQSESTAVPPELGNPGGKGSGTTANTYNNAAAGGGGAGGPGADGHSSDTASGSNRRQGGNGGPGVASDITGATLWYAGGGGGGCWTDSNGGYKGLGGSGVGGDGGGYTAEVNQNRTSATAGAAGTGSGGGGAFDFKDAKDAQRLGGAGGCGAFILRLAANAAGDTPEAAIESATAGASSAQVLVALRSAGSAATADLSLVYGPSADRMTLSAPVATGAAPGTFAATLSGLAPGSTWSVAPVVVAAGVTVTGAVAAVAIPAAPAVSASAGAFGLWQTQRSTTQAAFQGLFTGDEIWTEALSSNLVSGTIAANSRTRTITDPLSGAAYSWNVYYGFYAYRGWMRLEGGRTYAFGTRFQDSAYLAVGGLVLFSTCKTRGVGTAGTFTPPATGWYELDVRVGISDNGAFGPDSKWPSFGVAFNADGVTDTETADAWTALLDPGDGSLLRPDKPAARAIELQGAAASGTALSLAAKAGPGETAAHAYAVYGTEDAGTASLSDWGQTIDLGEVAAAQADTDLTATVTGWGSAAKVARLVLATGTDLAWTEAVALSDTALPSLADVHVADTGDGDRLEIAATLSGGAAPCIVQLWTGTSASDLAVAATATRNAAGAFTIAAEDISAGSAVWWRLVATDASGAVARTEPAVAVLPGASRMFDSTDGAWDTVWPYATPFENKQRTVTFGGTLATLGAGETTGFLLRNDSADGFPAGNTTAPHEGETIVLGSAGTFSLDATLDWDRDVTWNWGVSNATATASWGMTAKARSDNVGRNTTIVDATAYTWAGGAAGLWTDAAAWTPDGVWDDIAGFPRRGSYASFPANASAVVSVPDFETKLRFTRLTLGKNADVTFSPAAGASAAFLEMQEETAVSSSRTWTLSLGQGSALRFIGPISALLDYGNPISYANADTTVELADGADVTLGNNNGGTAFTMNVKSNSKLIVRDGATLTARGWILINGDGSQIVVDDATLQHIAGAANDSCTLRFNARKMNGKAALVLRGAAPVVEIARRVYISSTDSADKTQYIDFEVPVGGWQDAPIRSRSANTTYKFGQGSTANYFLAPRIPTNSPAVLAGQTLDVPLVRWPLGILASAVSLDRENLPHPATDSFFTATDPLTGHVVLYAHIVGQADTDAPQATNGHVTSLGETAVAFAFDAIPGKDASGAFLSTAYSYALLDAQGSAVAGATLAPASATIAAYATNAIAVSGLAAATDYTLRISMDDGTHAVATVDYAFRTLDDWGEGESATADIVAADGPFTVWTFTNANSTAQSFTVTRGGMAEVLIVGGGGAGGAGQSGTEYGGGGGGGGQVIATNLVLVPGVYVVRVGAGGARGTGRASGANGSATMFDAIFAAGGGGGGYNAAGLAGSSGGGGASGKAGGAATAGFAGGAGVSKGAGGGGGGAGSAGIAGSGTFGGRGGAGVTNSISGHPAVYGAGGGGGAAGSYSTYKGWGGGGAPTAGHGGEMSFEARLPANLATMSGAPGFGGGGGGGGSSSDAADYSVGSCYGGAGGAGTVIVRMRTASATLPAPQASLKSSEAGEASWTGTLQVYSLGAGADHVDATLRVARDGAATTNDFALGSVSATGLTSLAATGLAPDSDYAGVLVLDNGLVGGILEIPVSFSTAASSATTEPAGSSWTFGQWTSDAANFHATSLLRDVLPAEAVDTATGAAATEANPNRLVNGTDDYYELYPNRRLAWTWVDPVYLTSFRVFYNASDYRSGVNVASVEALGADGEWTVISPEPGHYNAKWGKNYGYLLPAAGTDYLWEKPAYGIRFTTDAFSTSGFHNFREVEAEGVPASTVAADLSVSKITRTAAGVKALVAFSRALQADATVKAFLAAAHGGTDEAAWTTAATAQAAAGALSQAFSIDDESLAGMNYLRFDYVDANDVVRWSETVYLPDVEIADSVPPTVAIGGVSDATAGSVRLAVNLVDAGSGASGGKADVYVRYAIASNAVASATPVLVAQNAAEGTTSAVLSGLMPARTYWAQVVAVNAEGGANGTGYSDYFAFATAADEFGTGGGDKTSAANGWETGTWNTTQTWATNNLLRGVVATATLPEGTTATGTPGLLTDGVVSTASGTYYTIPGGTVLEFELPGVCSLSEFRLYQYWNNADYGRAYLVVDSLSWRDEAGDWHEIDGSSLVFNDKSGNNYGYLRPADGSQYLAVGATALRFVQGTVTAQASLREMELLGTVTGSHRVLAIDDAAWSAGTLTATVSRPVTNASGTIWAVCGATYHGADKAAWEADGGAAVSIGALAANEAAATGSFAPAAGAAYVRFFETDAGGTVVAWSDTLPASAAAVRVVDLGATADGDMASFPIRVANPGTGTLTVVVQVSADDTFANPTEIAVAADGAGDYLATYRMEPGGAIWYRVVARTTDGGYDETPVGVLTTTRQGSILAYETNGASVSHRTVTAYGTLETIGAGVTTVYFMVGETRDTMQAVESKVLTGTGKFVFVHEFHETPRHYYYAFRTVNVASGGTSWTSSSRTDREFWTADAVTYTWKIDVEEGAWDNPSNWLPSAYADNCTGYPSNSQASVAFPSASTNTVHVPGKYRFANWSLGNNNGTAVTFVGEGADVSGLTGNMQGGSMKNCNLTFSALSLTEDNGFEIGQSSDFGKGWNTTITFSDDADAYFKGWLALTGRDMNVAVLDGATLRFSTSNGLANASANGGLRLDGGTVRGHYVYTDYGFEATTNQWFEISGAAPRIELAGSFRNSRDATGYRQDSDTSFLFTVPEDAWKDPVIYSENEDGMFAGMLGAGPGKYTIAVDPKSPFYKTAHKRTVALVAWKGGIDTSHVTLVDPPKTTTLYYTYGWPSVLTEPANAGDAPTGVRATLRGYGGTLLLIK